MHTGGCAIISEDPLVAYLVYREVIKQLDFTKQPDVLVYSPKFSPEIKVRPEDLYSNGYYLHTVIPFAQKYTNQSRKSQFSLDELRERQIKSYETVSTSSFTAFDAFKVAEGTRAARKFQMNALFPDIDPNGLREYGRALYLSVPTIIPSADSTLQPITAQMLDEIRDEIINDIRSGGISQSDKSEAYIKVEQLASEWAKLVVHAAQQYEIGQREELKKVISILPKRQFYSVDPDVTEREKSFSYTNTAKYMPFYLDKLLDHPSRHGSGIIGIHGGIGPEAGLHTFQLCQQATPDTSLLLASMGRAPIETDYLLSLNESDGQDPDIQRREIGNKRPRDYSPMHNWRRYNIEYGDREIRQAMSGSLNEPKAERDLPADPRAFLSDVRREMGEALGDDAICLMACNTAHVFHDELLLDSKGEWLHLPMEGLKSIDPAPEGRKRKIMILATPASLRTGLYEKTLAATGRDDLELLEIDDETMDVYYDVIFNDVSYQRYEEGASKTLAAIEKYAPSMQEGDVILLGCTEFSVPQVAEQIIARYGKKFKIIDNDVAAVKQAALLVKEQQAYRNKQDNALPCPPEPLKYMVL